MWRSARWLSQRSRKLPNDSTVDAESQFRPKRWLYDSAWRRGGKDRRPVTSEVAGSSPVAPVETSFESPTFRCQYRHGSISFGHQTMSGADFLEL